MHEKGRTFLTADWNDLVFLSFKVEDAILKPFLPPGTELDRFEGSAVVSLVAFRFLSTKFFGIRPPFAHSFAELNLRFYVREKRSQTPGVVFIREICPHYPVAWMAKAFFKERFLVMKCEFSRADDDVSYAFGMGEARGEMTVRLEKEAPTSVPGAAPDFLVRRFHGFSKWNASSLLHYEVSHAAWNLQDAALKKLSLPFAAWYPPDIAAALAADPFCILYSSGSEVALSCGSISNVESGEIKGRIWSSLVRAS